MAQKVLFKRKTTEEINDLEVEDGSLIYNIDNGKTYMDYENKRIQTGGNADTMIAIGGDEPTDDDIKLWIPESNIKTKASEVIDSLDGNETDYAPSVRAVNDKFDDIDKKFIYSSDERVIGKWTDGKPLYQKIVVAPFSGTGPVFDTGITSGSVGVIWIDGNSFILTKAGDSIPVNVYESSSQFCRFKVSSSGNSIVGSTSATAYYTGTGYFILNYTKTTD